MDPALHEALRIAQPSEELEVILRLHRGADLPPRFRPVSRFDRIATGRIAARDVSWVRAHEFVRSLKAGRPVTGEHGLGSKTIESDTVLHEADAHSLSMRRPRLQTGRGVVVGAVDFGLDVAHENFLDSEGNTRLLSLWDQGGTSCCGNCARPYGYGRFHSRQRINEALRSPDPYESLGYAPWVSDRGQGAHGTHVMDIAAGSGRLADGPSGVAPNADLVFVQLATKHTRAAHDLGDSIRLIEALDYVFKTARERPCVINLSVGGMAGSHDGTSLVELGMDEMLAAAPGRAICQSAGNYFASRTHASGRLSVDGSESLTWAIHPEDRTLNELEIWYPNPDRFFIRLLTPDHQIAAEVELGESAPIFVGGQRVGTIYHRRAEPNNYDHHVNAFLSVNSPAGDWHVEILPREIIDGSYHAWIERDASGKHQSRFAGEDTDESHTIGTICNGRLPIVVGAYDGFSHQREMAPFSSEGPTRDGRIKPDVIAPGVRILAARSTQRDEAVGSGLVVHQSGTSMATPHVTGTVALLFEAAQVPLPIEVTRTLILNAAEPARGTTRAGAGYLNTEALLNSSPWRNSEFERKVSKMDSLNGIEQTDSAEESTGLALVERFSDIVSSEQIGPGYMGALDALLPQEQRVQEGTLVQELFSEAAPWSAASPGSTRGFRVVGYPGQRLSSVPLPGDVLLRRAWGEGGFVSASMLANNAGYREFEVENAGVPSEGVRPGLYYEVLETNPYRRSATTRIARRISDPRGYLPHNQMLLRARAEHAENPVALALGAAALGGFAGAVFTPLANEAFRYARGGYDIQSVAARHDYQQTPPNVCVFKKARQWHVRGIAPMSTDSDFYFRLELTYDGVGVKEAKVVFDASSSSSLISSSLRLQFRPVQHGSSADMIKGVLFNIEGRWDPMGSGDAHVSGRVLMTGNGNISATIRSSLLREVSERPLGRPLNITGGGCRRAHEIISAGTAQVPSNPTPATPQPPWSRPSRRSSGRTRRSHRMTSVLPPQTTPNGLDVFFANNSTRLTAGTQQGIMRWYTGLGPGAQMQLRTGQWPIQIQGFASPSGRYEYNMALSNRRAQAVASFLRSVIGQGAQINVAARGEITQGGDEARQRRVSIIVPLGR